MDAKYFEAKIADDVVFGKNVTVGKPSNLYGCKIGNNSFVGPFVEIQKRTTIGHNTRISSHSFVCEKVTIGNHCFVAHNVKFANDLFKSGGLDPDESDWIDINIGNYVTIGTGAIIMTRRICDYASIGAGAVVTRDITEPGIYAGVPAKPIREFDQETIDSIIEKHNKILG